MLVPLGEDSAMNNSDVGFEFRHLVGSFRLLTGYCDR